MGGGRAGRWTGREAGRWVGRKETVAGGQVEAVAVKGEAVAAGSHEGGRPS